MNICNIPAYVYYVKHIPSGKFYYGSRYKNIHKNILPCDDFWINYFTSSKKIKELRKNYGDDCFERAIIFTSLDPKECFKYEQIIIKENINNPLCLNGRYFDFEKSNKIFCNFGRTLSTKGKPKSEDTKQKMRKPKSNEHKRAISEAQKRNGGNGPKNILKNLKIKQGKQ